MACGVLLAGSLSVHATAADIRVAVAVNFMEPIKEIGVTFQKASGHKLVLSFGATGQFYAQIAQGAPFEILLSADAATPAKAIREGHAVPETAFTYAVGKLVLYSGTPQLTLGEATLREGAFTKVAIANPATAPYGAAAVETLKSLGLHDAVERKLVLGNNIAQTLQFIDTGHAEIGFVALSQVIMGSSGSRWVVPAHLYTPIAQDAVLLKPGAESAAAKHFLAFLQRAESRAVIEKFGYGTGQ
jgi:molybdate transport system substrate-binding protein